MSFKAYLKERVLLEGIKPIKNAVMKRTHKIVNALNDSDEEQKLRWNVGKIDFGGVPTEFLFTTADINGKDYTFFSYNAGGGSSIVAWNYITPSSSPSFDGTEGQLPATDKYQDDLSDDDLEEIKKVFEKIKSK